MTYVYVVVHKLLCVVFVLIADFRFTEVKKKRYLNIT